MNIAFIAMSGIRLQNSALVQLGLTLPGFLERGRTIASLPSLSLLTLAALTPERHEVHYIEIADLRKDGDPPVDFDLVAISTYSAQAGEAYELADYYRRHGVPVVLGGLHVTACPEEAAAHCDAVAVGEGEPLWPRILADAERHRLQPVYRLADPRGYNLADAPIPRFDLLDPDRYNRLTVQTTRGCPFRCDFCASSVLLTQRYKIKPPEKVLAEIRAIRAVWDRPFIEFADDNSFASKAAARRLMAALADEGIRWFTEVDVSVGADEDLVALMRAAGCRQVLIGLESPRPQSLDGIELKRNWKATQLGRYPDAIARLQSHGIRVVGCFVLGLDGDTPEVFDEVYEYAAAIGLSDVQVTVLTPFPGTPLYARLAAAGRILRRDAWDQCTLFDVNFVPKQMSVQQLEEGFYRLVERLYTAEATRARKHAFKEGLRRSATFRPHRLEKLVPHGSAD